jgi:hypothetical protein
MGVNCKYWYPCRVWRKVFLAGVVCAKNMIEARGHTSAIERIHCHFDRVEFLFKTQKEALFFCGRSYKKKRKKRAPRTLIRYHFGVPKMFCDSHKSNVDIDTDTVDCC